MSDSITYSGSLNVYFPCKLKRLDAISQVEKRWRKMRTRQERDIFMQKNPLTDLLDKRLYRDEGDFVLSMAQDTIRSDSYINHSISPYALHCIKNEYYQSRESAAFTKQASVLLSRFEVECSNISSKPIQGISLLNVNHDNRVATVIIVLNFQNLTINEIILMKHLFYKRGKIDIKDHYVHSISDTHPCGQCNSLCNFPCVSSQGLRRHYSEITFQEYVMNHFPYMPGEIEIPMDCRARYSLLEVYKPNDNYPLLSEYKKRMYGLLKADEGWQNSVCNLGESISTRETYKFYLSGYNGLIVTNQDCHRKYIEKRNQFRDQLTLKRGHIEIPNIMPCGCVSGAWKKHFPTFLKTVEVHYLTNDVLTSEFSRQDKSYFNPITFIKRGFKLWKIIYELDINKSHQDERMLKSFGVTKNMGKIKEEYQSILTHGMTYFALMIAIFSLLATII